MSTATATAERSVWLRSLARLGLFARGVTYLLVGWLVLDLVIGRQKHQTSDKGAFQTLASHPWGKVILIVLAVGFGGYAAWGLIRALSRDRFASGAKAVVHRLAAAGQAVIYGFLCYLAVALVVGAHSKEGSGDPAPLTAKVMSAPSGRLGVVIAGAAVVLGGLILAERGARAKFEEDMAVQRMGEGTRKAERTIGRVGTVARGVVVMIVGGFLLGAGIHHHAGEAKGLDASLVDVGHHPFGLVALVLVAVGLACFGLFSMVEARYRRL